jgi:hypothetical protein
MREIAFQVLSDQPGRLQAWAEREGLSITANSHEDLHHEAREALIAHFGSAHSTVRIRIRPLGKDRRLLPLTSLATRAAA